ncbi:MAG: RNA polymerase sigma factor [Marinifilaceae bacterium]|jgi:RNA polymerase sigma-70 factor (ECF subfamily)
MNELYHNLHQDIIDRCLLGDAKAQFQLYKLYYKAMYNTCLRIVKEQQEAEDIMQEAFLAAFKSMHKYKGEVSFGAWLKRIVVNRSIDYLKKKKIDLCPIDEKLYKLSNSDHNSDSELHLEQVEKVKKAMNQLPDGYRVILNLYLLEGYDHEEISGILGISGSTSRSQYSRAKKKLMELLENV